MVLEKENLNYTKGVIDRFNGLTLDGQRLWLKVNNSLNNKPSYYSLLKAEYDKNCDVIVGHSNLNKKPRL